MHFLSKFIKKSTKEKVFSDCIEQHSDALYRHALWMTGNKDTAMDMVQEAFYQAWISIDSLKDKDKSLAWLLTIQRRAVYKEQRYHYRQVETLTELAQLPQFDENAAHGDSYQLLEIYSMLEGLSASHRDVFLLHHLHGFSYDEIGQQLDVPVGTVMSRLSRARMELKKIATYSEDNLVPINSAVQNGLGKTKLGQNTLGQNKLGKNK